MRRAADEFDFIAQRVRELEAERAAVRNEPEPAIEWPADDNFEPPAVRVPGSVRVGTLNEPALDAWHRTIKSEELASGLICRTIVYDQDLEVMRLLAYDPYDTAHPF